MESLKKRGWQRLYDFYFTARPHTRYARRHKSEITVYSVVFYVRTGSGLWSVITTQRFQWRLIIWSKINLLYIEEAGDLWAEEMEIPLTVIHNRISIRQAGLHGYNDYFQSIALKGEKSMFWKRCYVLSISASKTLFKMEKKMVVREPSVMKSPVKA